MSKRARAPLSFNMEKATAVTPVAGQPNPPAANKARKPAKAESRPHRVGRQFIAAHVPQEAAKQFKLLAVQQDRTTQGMLIEALNDLFAKYNLSRIA